MAFIIIGALGFVWMGFWIFVYKKPSENKMVNAAELAYIEQDAVADAEFAKKQAAEEATEGKKMSLGQVLKHKEAWAFILGRFLTDGVWWFS